MTNRLDTWEAERNSVQEVLGRRRPAAERNRLGQFGTPTALALEMALLAKQHLPARGGIRFLDPGVGTGVFFYAACKALGTRRVRSALGFEIDPEVATEAERLWASLGLHVRFEDFCAAPPPTAVDDKATLVLCNPPYVRHHHLSTGQKVRLREEVELARFHVSGLAGLYSYFLLLAHRWLAPRGVGVWIMPAEFLDVNYGQALKDYLCSRVTLFRLHRFDPEDVQFADALVSSVVVAFVNELPPRGHRVLLNSGSRLLEPQLVHEIPLTALDPAGKWGPLFTRPVGIRATEGGLTVGDLFFVKRGLATGANEFFILERQQARALGLPSAYLRPILPSPRYIPSACIDRAPDGFPAELPELVLLDCDLPIEEIRRHAPALARYLHQGVELGIPQRYLPAHRPLWYRQEQRPPAPIICTYMGRQNGGRAIRFLRNRSNATAPNVYLLLYPKPKLADAVHERPEILEAVFAGLTEVATDLAHRGRVYGGGLNKIEPKELEAVALPAWVRKRYGILVVGEQGRLVTAPANERGCRRRRASLCGGDES